MGLAITSGEYAFMLKEDPEGAEWMEEDFSSINAALKKNGIKEHLEPKELPEVSMSCIEGFPYSFLHYLRRVYALHRLQKEITPTNGELNDKDDSFVAEVTDLMDSHLLCHSDAEGYYVPIEFDEVIFSDDLPGAMLGSSQKLFAEILDISNYIGVEVVDGEILQDTYNELAEASEEHQFYIERVVWFTLYEHCKNSIKNNTLIQFC
jgi:hypothetical protein